MAALAQTIAQGTEHMAVIADAINRLDSAASGQQPNELQQQALREQAEAGASGLLNHLMGNVAPWPLQAADDKLPGFTVPGHAKGCAGQQGVIAVA